MISLSEYGFGSPYMKLHGPTGNLEHYLFPFGFACCNMYYLQCIYVSIAMVTLSTVYFLLTQFCTDDVRGNAICFEAHKCP